MINDYNIMYMSLQPNSFPTGHFIHFLLSLIIIV